MMIDGNNEIIVVDGEDNLVIEQKRASEVSLKDLKRLERYEFDRLGGLSMGAVVVKVFQKDIRQVMGL